MNSYDVSGNFMIEKTPITINTIKIRALAIELFTSVTLSVELFDENSNNIDNKIIKLTGDDYAKWGNDDTYIKNVVINKLYQLLQNTTTKITAI